MAYSLLTKRAHHARRAARTRSQMEGTATRPRLSVSRSLKHIGAQAIDDATGRTLAMATDRTDKPTGTKTERAAVVGKAIAETLIAAGIKTVIFDRGAFRYHGRVKALAEAARATGLIF